MNHDERKLKKQLQEMQIGYEQKKAQRKASRLRRAARPLDDDGGFDGRAVLKIETEELDALDLRSRLRRPRGEPAKAIPRTSSPVTAGEHGGSSEEPGVVVGLAAGRCRVRHRGEEVDARLAPALLVEQRTAVAVGDEVRLAERGGAWRAEAVLPRRSRLARPDPQNPHLERVLAANVELVVVASAVRAPGVKMGLIDRVLLAAGDAGAGAAICINKVDLAGEHDEGTELRQLETYRALGVAVVLCSAHTGFGIQMLAETIGDRTAVLVGQSGCGKTSLLNALVPGLALHTGESRARDGKGRHTTTSSSLHALPAGGFVIDTPGVRQFGLWAPSREALERGFPDVQTFAARCRFLDCRHLREPDCEVRVAVARGELSPARWASYQRLHAELE